MSVGVGARRPQAEVIFRRRGRVVIVEVGQVTVKFRRDVAGELAALHLVLVRGDGATLGPADGLWVAWPKKAAKLDTDLDFAAVQEVGLDNGLVDNKSASLDETWQALRFVRRLADR